MGAGSGGAGAGRPSTALRKKPTEPKPCEALRSSGRASACAKKAGNQVWCAGEIWIRGSCRLQGLMGEIAGAEWGECRG